MNEQGDERRAQALEALKQPPFTLKKLIDFLGEPAQHGQAIFSFNESPQAVASVARRNEAQGVALYQVQWDCECIVNHRGIGDDGGLRTPVLFPSPCEEHEDLFLEWLSNQRPAD